MWDIQGECVVNDVLRSSWPCVEGVGRGVERLRGNFPPIWENCRRWASQWRKLGGIGRVSGVINSVTKFDGMQGRCSLDIVDEARAAEAMVVGRVNET